MNKHLSNLASIATAVAFTLPVLLTSCGGQEKNPPPASTEGSILKEYSALTEKISAVSMPDNRDQLCEGIAQYTAMIELFKNNGPVLKKLADARKLEDTLDSIEESYESRASLQDTNNDLNAAIDDYSQCLDPSWDDQAVSMDYYRRGAVRERFGDNPGAIADYSEAIKLRDPGNWLVLNLTDMYLARAKAYSHVGEYKKAIDDYSAALKRCSRSCGDQQEIFLDRADAYAASGDIEKAGKDYGAAWELRDPDDSAIEVLLRWAEGYRKLGRKDETLKIFAKAIARAEGSTSVYSKRAAAYESWGDKKNALADYDVVVNENYDADSYLQRANAYKKFGEKGKAKTDFEKVVELASESISSDSPKNDWMSDFLLVEEYVNRAKAYMGLESHDKALADLTQAITLDPRKLEHYELRAQVHDSLAKTAKSPADAKHHKELAAEDRKTVKGVGAKVCDAPPGTTS